MTEIENVKWDVIGLSGTQIKETNIEILQWGHHLFNSGNETSRSNGVGFIVHKSIIPLILSYQAISDRFAILTLQGKSNKMTIIQTYLPTTSYTDEDVEAIYNKIQNLVNKIPKRDSLFIMGDFNARVGGLHTDYPSYIGKHTIGTSNARGERLAKFCAANNLFLTNTFFKKRRIHTWNHPNGINVGQIDFIATRASQKSTITDSSVINTPDVSDHRMVRTKVKTHMKWPSPKKRPKSHNLDALKEPAILKKFQLKLSNRFQALAIDDDDINRTSDKINASILATANEVLPSPPEPKPNWMTTETKTAIDKKKMIRKEKGNHSIQYKVAKAETKKLVKRDKLNETNDDLDYIASLPPDKQYFRAMKKLKTTRKNISWAIKDKNGKLLTSKNDILERWASYYEELYAQTDDNGNSTPITQNELETLPITEQLIKLVLSEIKTRKSPGPDDDDEQTNNNNQYFTALNDLEIPTITVEEIKHAISKLKNGKSPGLDEIYNEYIKAGGEPLINALQILFNNILKYGVVPQNFKEALIVILFKKGNRSECKNYRPISLLSHIYKLFMTIIAKRITNDLYTCFTKTQAAYQPGRNTTEQIFALEQLIEKSIEFNRPMHIVFIDFKKAFDSINLNKLWKILDRTPINKNYINLLKSTYDQSTAIIKTDLGISRRIDIKRGAKQGDILSAILFCVALSAVLLLTEEENATGYTIGGEII